PGSGIGREQRAKADAATRPAMSSGRTPEKGGERGTEDQHGRRLPRQPGPAACRGKTRGVHTRIIASGTEGRDRGWPTLPPLPPARMLMTAAHPRQSGVVYPAPTNSRAGAGAKYSSSSSGRGGMYSSSTGL